MANFRIKKISSLMPHQTSNWSKAKSGLASGVKVEGASVFGEVKNMAEFRKRMSSPRLDEAEIRSGAKQSQRTAYDHWYNTHTDEEKKAINKSWAKPSRKRTVEEDIIRLKKKGY